jgi:flagellar biogenesis protein FliO
MADPSAFDVFARMLPPLALIVGSLLLLRRWAAKGRGGVGTGPRVLGRTGVTRNAVIAVIDAGGRRFLVGAGDHGVNLLAELDQDVSALGGGETIELATNAETDLAPARPAFAIDRPWMGLIHRLQQMTVRTHLQGPIHGADR